MIPSIRESKEREQYGLSSKQWMRSEIGESRDGSDIPTTESDGLKCSPSSDSSYQKN